MWSVYSQINCILPGERHKSRILFCFVFSMQPLFSDLLRKIGHSYKFNCTALLTCQTKMATVKTMYRESKPLF